MKKGWVLIACVVALLAACRNDNEPSKRDVSVPREQTEVTSKVEVKYEIDPKTYLVQPLPEINTNKKLVLLTIDDAPEHYSVEMARTLKEVDAPAIFFVNGHFLEDDRGKDKLKEIYELGFAIGNHTMTHARLSELSTTAQTEEIVALNDLVASIIGERPRFFRAPFGVNTDHVRELAKREGMTLMNWTYGYDWEPNYQTGASIAEVMVNSEYLQPGANLLMHDRKWSAEGLADIVIGLRDQGYEFVDPLEIQTVDVAN
ncbi:polysaccharide deacetylase family protein [Shouchella lonarensis]|uniref:Peptidoglycan/xylan/chitin deacetylase, PgdA/CDA1 family n=1 Tax=Shouchella lonarensis TaxID=1464122 RepID=A0A1G6KRM3_9BACI|nr:polysaccharide deacetylase family protein [Shouchella lonarensis]SDC33461.1 Peptidoglycan/xylan/chitin deacetylase, PgdA/CDA1 family [Shouchella lonarensis]